MKLLIKFGYRGVSTKERFYSKGEYDLEENPQLKGIADYLVKNGHAEWVGEADPTPIEIAPSDTKEEAVHVQVEIEFTAHAKQLLDDEGYNLDDAEAYFHDRQINYVKKSDAVDYIDALSDSESDD